MSGHNCASIPKTTLLSKPKLMKKWNRPKPMKFTIQPSIWMDILEEDREIEHYLKRKEDETLPSFECESNFVKDKLFPTLIPAFQRACAVVLKHSAHVRDVRLLNFLDLLAEILWNKNSTHPERLKGEWKSIYRVYENEQFYKSRPFFQYRLFLSSEEAATIIQAKVRGFLIRIKIDLGVMTAERDRVREASRKQRECFDAYKDVILETRDCVCEGEVTGASTL